MNEVFVRRLIGLAVLLVAVFGLTWLLPHGLSNDEDIPSTTVPLDTAEVRASSMAETPTAAEKPKEGPSDAPESVLDSAVPKPVIVPPGFPPTNVKSLVKSRVNPKPLTVPKTSKSIALSPKLEGALAASKSTTIAEKHAETKKSDRTIVSGSTEPHTSTASANATKPIQGPNAVALAAPSGPLVPATSTPNAKIWFVQIGSYSDHDKAQTTVSLLQNVGYRAEIAQVTGPGNGTLQRVRIGPFPSEAVARRAQDRIAHQGYPDSRAVSDARDAH